MPKEKSSNIPADTLALYDKLIGTVPDIERKGDTVPYTSLNGNMFSYIGKDGLLALRLPKEEIGAFLEKYKTTNASSYGIVQKEYVAVPHSLFNKTVELKSYFRASLDYVSSLKPKQTAKSKKK